MANIFLYGNVTLDVVLDTPHAPIYDEEVRARTCKKVRGGNGANAATLLAQMGHQVSFSGVVGDDEAGQFLIQNLQRFNLELSALEIQTNKSTPTSYIALSMADASRTIIHHRDLPEMNFETITSVPFATFDWLHFEGRNLDVLEATLVYVRSFLTEQPISLEIEKPRENIEALISLVDIIMFSKTYANAKGFDDGEVFLKSIQVDYPNLAMATCTWGSEGAYAIDKSGRVYFAEGESVTAVDTIGAGDAFNAALIDALASQQNLGSALQAANAFAAKKVAQQGFEGLIESTPATDLSGIVLCQADELNEDLGARGFELEDKSIFVVKKDGQIFGYENKCPHIGIELNFQPDVFVNLEKTHIQCAQHMAVFEPETGQCVAGPCVGQSLTPVKISVESDQVYYYPE